MVRSAFFKVNFAAVLHFSTDGASTKIYSLVLLIRQCGEFDFWVFLKFMSSTRTQTKELRNSLHLKVYRVLPWDVENLYAYTNVQHLAANIHVYIYLPSALAGDFLQ